MTDVTLQDLPPAARAAWVDLRDRLRSALGDDLVAMWAHGGTTSVSDPAHAGDLAGAEMAPFVAFVREHLPPATDRPPGDLPRWSGF